MKTGNPFEIDVEVRRPDGEQRWIRARGALSPDAAAAPVRMHASTLTTRRPGLRVLFMADYIGTTLSRPVGSADSWRVVAKPFTRLELTRPVRETLDEWEPPPPNSTSVDFSSGPDTA